MTSATPVLASAAAIGLALMLLTGCVRDDASLSSGDTATAGISLRLLPPATSTTPITANVNQVTVTVTGDGLDSPLVESLTIANSEARGTLNLPFGQKTIRVAGAVVRPPITIPLFAATRTVNVDENTGPVTIQLTPLTAEEFGLHDGTPETTVWGLQPNTVLAGFYGITGSVFPIGVDMYLDWGAANDGPYRVVIFRGTTSFSMVFQSENYNTATNGWIRHPIVWSQPRDGIFTDGSGMVAGIQYLSANEWPEIGYDMSNPSASGLVFDPGQGQWVTDPDGDFLITIVFLGADGSTRFLTPDGLVLDEDAYGDWKAARTGVIGSGTK